MWMISEFSFEWVQGLQRALLWVNTSRAGEPIVRSTCTYKKENVSDNTISLRELPRAVDAI
jgi:hypothetical protein